MAFKTSLDNKLLNVSKGSVLKGLRETFVWTPETLSEYEKCSADPVYFIENYFYIVTEGRIELMKLRRYQRRMIKAMHRGGSRTVARISRQLGKTTLMAGYICWTVNFNPVKTVAVCAHKMKGARETLKRVKFGFSKMPRWMQMGIKTWNESSLVLENDSQIMCYPTTADGVRGQTVDLLYVDEFDVIGERLWTEFWQACQPSVSANKDAIIALTSTPKGLKQMYRFCRDADAGRNGYVHIYAPYTEIPGRDEAWKQKEIEGFGGGPVGEAKFKAEYECAFLGSSETLVHVDVLGAIQIMKPIDEKYGCLVYRAPEAGHRYVADVDIAHGKGGSNDYSVVQVIDVTSFPYRQVAVFRDNQVSKVAFAEIVDQIGRLYNDAWIIVERNIAGVGELLDREWHYPNLVYSMGMGRKGQVPEFKASGSNSQDYGVTMSEYVKRLGCDNLKMMVTNKTMELVDADTVDELFRFSKTNKGSFKAESGHDDLVMPLVAFAWFAGTEEGKEWLGTDAGELFLARKRQERAAVDGPVKPAKRPPAGIWSSRSAAARQSSEFDELAKQMGCPGQICKVSTWNARTGRFNR